MAAIHWELAVDGNWNDPNKWQPNTTTTAADDVTISVAGSYTVSLTDEQVAKTLTFDQTNAKLIEIRCRQTDTIRRAHCQARPGPAR